MNSETIELLRAATIQALQNKQDIAAGELLGLINPEPVKAMLPALSPSTIEVVNGPAHDYHYWARFVRENFIPFMTSNGRLRFTSFELITWLENCKNLPLTSGDIEVRPGDSRTTWKGIMSNALSSLKSQGILKAPAFGKEYEICQQLAPAPRRVAIAPIRRLSQTN